MLALVLKHPATVSPLSPHFEADPGTRPPSPASSKPRDARRPPVATPLLAECTAARSPPCGQPAPSVQLQHRSPRPSEATGVTMTVAAPPPAAPAAAAPPAVKEAAAVVEAMADLRAAPSDIQRYMQLRLMQRCAAGWRQGHACRPAGRAPSACPRGPLELRANGHYARPACCTLNAAVCTWRASSMTSPPVVWEPDPATGRLQGPSPRCARARCPPAAACAGTTRRSSTACCWRTPRRSCPSCTRPPWGRPARRALVRLAGSRSLGPALRW